MPGMPEVEEKEATEGTEEGVEMAGLEILKEMVEMQATPELDLTGGPVNRALQGLRARQEEVVVMQRVVQFIAQDHFQSYRAHFQAME